MKHRWINRYILNCLYAQTILKFSKNLNSSFPLCDCMNQINFNNTCLCTMYLILLYNYFFLIFLVILYIRNSDMASYNSVFHTWYLVKGAPEWHNRKCLPIRPVITSRINDVTLLWLLIQQSKTDCALWIAGVAYSLSCQSQLPQPNADIVSSYMWKRASTASLQVCLHMPQWMHIVSFYPPWLVGAIW